VLLLLHESSRSGEIAPLLGFKSPSDTTHYPIFILLTCEFIRPARHISPDFAFSGQVSDLKPELVVNGCLQGTVGVGYDLMQVAEAGDEGTDVVFGEPAASLAAALAGVAGQCRGALGLDLAGPPGDGLGVGPGVEGGLVAGQAGVAVGDDDPGVLAGPGGLGGGGRSLGLR
jgi:hypothetical protein